MAKDKHAKAVCGPPIDCGDNFPQAWLPPVRVEPSATQCNHTPCPEGYLQWQEWARQASKTHMQIHCPRCGLWAIWLPKAEAKPINAQHERESRHVSRAYQKLFDEQEFERLRKKLRK